MSWARTAGPATVGACGGRICVLADSYPIQRYSVAEGDPGPCSTGPNASMTPINRALRIPRRRGATAQVDSAAAAFSDRVGDALPRGDLLLAGYLTVPGSSRPSAASRHRTHCVSPFSFFFCFFYVVPGRPSRPVVATTAHAVWNGAKPGHVIAPIFRSTCPAPNATNIEPRAAKDPPPATHPSRTTDLPAPMAPLLDPEVASAMAPMMAVMATVPKMAVGDIDGRRKSFAAFLEAVFRALPTPADVATKDYHTTTSDGHPLLLRWITKTSASATTPTAAVVYAHGGGMIMADVDIYKPLLMGLVSQSGVPFLAVDFRPAPEHRGPTMAEDCFAGLTWLHSNAASLNVDPARIAVMGDSGGGCVAAACAILARDRHISPPLAKQILIYPMLDDRTVKEDASLGAVVTWTHEDNVTAWAAVTGRSAAEVMASSHSDSTAVSPYTAPARLTDATGLAPAYIDVGALDLFRDEDVAYARLLAVANVAVELHVRAGCPHAWEALAPNAAVTTRALADRLRALHSL